MEDLLAKQEFGGAPVEVKTFQSLSKEAIRAVVWQQDCSVVMFPPFFSFPDISKPSRADLDGFVRAGGELKGTVVFVGGALEVEVINKVFGWDIESRYAGGPYYKNERNAREDTSFGELPAMVPEAGQVIGMWMPSMPPSARSLYDSFGVSVACCLRRDLGRVCFLAQDFLHLLKEEAEPWEQLLEAMINFE